MTAFIPPPIPPCDPATGREYQPATSAFQTAVPPNGLSSISLSGGKTIPFHYYLGANSTVPLVRLESPSTHKELTWGDTVELPPGTIVNVRNISYMQGDIQIQSGPTPAAPPRRITIPLDYEIPKSASDEGNVWAVQFRTRYPCDTRRAVRAYLTWGLPAGTIEADIAVVITGFCQQHSGGKQAGLPVYTDTYHFKDLVPDFIPLGTSLEGNAMRLADFARVDAVITARLEAGQAFRLLDLFYVVEY